MTILSTYSSGYSLAAAGILTITKAGTIGGTGLAAYAGSTTVNQGLIDTVAVAGGTGLAGNAAARLSGLGVTLANSGTIVGGTAGSGIPGTGTYNGGAEGNWGRYGGVGGAGVSVTTGTMTNTRSIVGGVGGVGGAGAYGKSSGGRGGSGGLGGAGVVLDAASLINTGTITGGAGGAGGNGGNGGDFGGVGLYGGNGGAGVLLKTGTVVNRGLIQGGRGGAGGAGGLGSISNGASLETGAPGVGIDALGGGTIINAPGGVISGYFGVSGVGGTTTVINFSTIIGTGTDCIGFSGYGDVIAEPGSVFVGRVSGTSLTLAGGIGTISNLGGKGMLSGAVVGTYVVGFKSYALDDAGTWSLKGGASLASFQTLTVDARSVLKLSGISLADAGAVDVMGLPNAVARMIVSGANTISGGGKVVLNGAGHIVASAAGGALTLAGATISGGGAIEGALALTISAGGIIDANGGVMVINTGATAINQGLIETTATGELVLRDTTVAGSGGVSDGHKLELDHATLSGGSLSVATGAVLLSVTGGGVVNLGGGTVVNAGIIEGAAGGLSIDGAVANSDIVEAMNGALTVTGAVTGSGSARIVGSGVLEIDGVLGENAAFTAGSTGRLVLGDPAEFAGTVSGLSKTGANQIDLKELTFKTGDAASFTGTATGGILTVRDSTQAVIATLQLAGDYRRSSFVLADGGADGLAITANAAALTSAMAGFAAPVAAHGSPGGGSPARADWTLASPSA